jgi:endoplasmic reticulum-Golgi intermediate compartment protein 3
MPAKSRFTRLDAFTKTVDEARVRTTSGGIVTIASLLIVLYLALGEWRDYRRVVVHPELIVDKGRGKSLLERDAGMALADLTGLQEKRWKYI